MLRGKALEDKKCRLSLRESTSFRGAKGDSIGDLFLYRAKVRLLKCADQGQAMGRPVRMWLGDGA